MRDWALFLSSGNLPLISPEGSKLQRDQEQQRTCLQRAWYLLPAGHFGLLGRKAKAFRAV